jgi:tetratricopeptide (TPR) repeat protein
MMQAVWTWAVVLAVGCAGTGWAEETPSDEALVQAQKDIEEARALDKAGKYDAAVTLSERALAAREKVLGPQHLQVAEALDLLGDLLRKRTELQRAELLIERGLRIRETILGKEHLAVAQSLDSLAAVYATLADWKRAESTFLNALQIREKILGKEDPDVARTLLHLAEVYGHQGCLWPH